MLGRVSVAFCVASSLFWGAPVLAGRTAIDQTPDGTPIYATISGYCDINGDDCGDGSGIFLPYQVSIGGSDFTNRIIVQGNGILTFGGAFPFFDDAGVKDSIYDQNNNGGPGPLLTDYGLTLVSAGQSNSLDFGSAFFQSASLEAFAATGAIQASWFICYAPTAPGVCPRSNPYSLTLTPTQGGFSGHFDFANGSPEGSDRGYVSGGVFTQTDDDFFLPATFQGLTLSVPEPATWAMLVAGFGLTGAAMRRQRRRPAISLG
jgi:hypothetical protein